MTDTMSQQEYDAFARKLPLGPLSREETDAVLSKHKLGLSDEGEPGAWLDAETILFCQDIVQEKHLSDAKREDQHRREVQLEQDLLKLVGGDLEAIESAPPPPKKTSLKYWNDIS